MIRRTFPLLLALASCRPSVYQTPVFDAACQYGARGGVCAAGPGARPWPPQTPTVDRPDP